MKTLPPGRSTKTQQGFTLVEMIGVLAVIAILASLLVPRVFQAIGDSKINNAASTCNSVKSAINEYYGKFGVIGDATGASLGLALDGALSEDWDLSTLVAGGFMEKPFAVKVGNGKIGQATGGSRLRVVNISGNTGATAIAGAAADLAQGSYDLDGDTDNDVTGQLVVEAVIEDAEEQDAKELNDRIDGTTLGAALGAADEKGRVKYTQADAGKVNIRIYLAHK